MRALHFEYRIGAEIGLNEMQISDFHHMPLDISRERLYVGNLFYILFHAFDLKYFSYRDR